MFARIVEFIPKFEVKEDFVKKVRNEVLPILKKHAGFLEILPLFPENKAETIVYLRFGGHLRVVLNSDLSLAR